MQDFSEQVIFLFRFPLYAHEQLAPLRPQRRAIARPRTGFEPHHCSGSWIALKLQIETMRLVFTTHLLSISR